MLLRSLVSEGVFAFLRCRNIDIYGVHKNAKFLRHLRAQSRSYAHCSIVFNTCSLLTHSSSGRSLAVLRARPSSPPLSLMFLSSYSHSG